MKTLPAHGSDSKSFSLPFAMRTLLLAAIGLGEVAAQSTEMVSLQTGGVEFPQPVDVCGVSDDGRKVVFVATSQASGSFWDLYLRDLVTDTTQLILLGAWAEFPAISGSGQTIAFRSVNGSLVVNDTNSAPDIFVVSAPLFLPERVSVADGTGAQANGYSDTPRLSDDGNRVVFASTSTNLTSQAVIPYRSNVFVRERSTRKTFLCSVTPSNRGSNGHSHSPVISGSGRFVAFESSATDIVPLAITTSQIYVRDLQTGMTAIVSRNDQGHVADGSCSKPSISQTGRFIAFASQASNLGGFVGAGHSIYVHDRDPDADGNFTNSLGKTKVVSVNHLKSPVSGPFLTPDISDDGQRVLFMGDGRNLEANPSGYVGVWLHDRANSQTTSVHLDSQGNPARGNASSSGFANSYRLALSGNGRVAVYSTFAGNLDRWGRDKNYHTDVYAHHISPGQTVQLGHWLAGTGGTKPEYTVTGQFGLGYQAFVRVKRARPSTVAFLVMSGQMLPRPAYGGIFVPWGGWSIGPYVTDRNGNIDLLLPVGPGPTYSQWWIVDSEGPQGFSLTNALRIN